MWYWRVIKWSRNLKCRFTQNRKESFDGSVIKSTLCPPFVKGHLYDSSLFVDERGSCNAAFTEPLFIQAFSFTRCHGRFPPVKWEQLLQATSCRTVKSRGRQQY